MNPATVWLFTLTEFGVDKITTKKYDVFILQQVQCILWDKFHVHDETVSRRLLVWQNRCFTYVAMFSHVYSTSLQ